MRTYGTIKYDREAKPSERKWIITDAEPHICIKLKAIFLKIGAGRPLPFHFHDSPEICHDLLWFMERYPLSISKEDLARMQREKRRHISNINDLEAVLLPDYKPTPVHLKDGYEARNYQITGKDVYMKCRRILIGDEIGLGKTLIAILSFLERGMLPAIVTVQTHLPKQWKDEIEKFTNLTVHLINGRKPYSLPPADVYIMKYSCLSGWVNVFQKAKFRSATFDECQELRRRESDKYMAAKTLADNVKYCLGLSASPIYNFGDEIFNVLDVIKQGCLGRQDDFLREWASYDRKVNDPKALGTYLRENMFMLRRTRKEVGRELPPVNKIVHTVGHDEDAVESAEELARQLAIKVVSGRFEERGQAARELDMLVRHTTGVSKAREVAEYVKILLENDEPVLLAGWHRDVYDIWLKALEQYKPLMYTGTESPVQKEKTKQAFINGDTNLMIISLRSGIGLDGLQHCCRTVVFGELDWSPKVHEQVIGRVDRDGQKDQVTAIYLISNFGSDPLIVDLLGIKSSQSHGIIDPMLDVPQQHSDESRIKLLAHQYLKKKQMQATGEEPYVFQN